MCQRGGDLIAYAVRQYDLQKNHGRSDIHLYDIPNQRDWVVARSLKSADELQFVELPAGPRLFYVGAPADDTQQPAESQVWSVDIAGVAPLQVTKIDCGVSHLKVSPRGTHLAFTSKVKIDATLNELYPDLPQAKARIIDTLLYRHWDAWHDYAYSHVHAARLSEQGSAEEVVDLMRGLRADCPLPPFGGAEQFSWSPDGTEIAYTAKVVNSPAESTDSDIFLVRSTGSNRPNVLRLAWRGPTPIRSSRRAGGGWRSIPWSARGSRPTRTGSCFGTVRPGACGS